MKLELKGIKTFRGMDGEGLNATLYVDGVKAAEIIDEGCGGEILARWLDGSHIYDTPLSRKVTAAIHKLPPEPLRPDAEEWQRKIGPTKPSFDSIIARMVDERDTAVRINRSLKTAVVFTVPGDPPHQWRTCKHRGKPESARAAMLKQHPTAQFVIAPLSTTPAYELPEA